jgi:hypothetical protein
MATELSRHFMRTLRGHAHAKEESPSLDYLRPTECERSASLYRETMCDDEYRVGGKGLGDCDCAEERVHS